MVVTSRPSWLRIFRQIGTPLATFFLISLAVSLVEETHPFRAMVIPDLAIAIIGSALGILLGFRTNSAYDRWWEARKLWGGLVNSSRSLARQAITFAPRGAAEADAFARAMIYEQIAFIHALRCALRDEEPWREIEVLVSAETIQELRGVINIPNALLTRLGLSVASAARSGVLDEWRWQRLDSTLTDLANLQGGCERIKRTPLPRQYDYYPELFIKVYCLLLPLALVDSMRSLTPVVTLLVSFAFLVMNRIGKNLEDPFDNLVYGTPLTAISTSIEIDLRQMLGETDLPTKVAPVKGVLV